MYLAKSPRENTPQSTSCTTTYLPSWKLSKLDEQDMQDTAGEAGCKKKSTSKQSKDVLNSEFSFSNSGYQIKAKKTTCITIFA